MYVVAELLPLKLVMLSCGRWHAKETMDIYHNSRCRESTYLARAFSRSGVWMASPALRQVPSSMLRRSTVAFRPRLIGATKPGSSCAALSACTLTARQCQKHTYVHKHAHTSAHIHQYQTSAVLYMIGLTQFHVQQGCVNFRFWFSVKILASVQPLKVPFDANCRTSQLTTAVMLVLEHTGVSLIL